MSITKLVDTMTNSSCNNATTRTARFPSPALQDPSSSPEMIFSSVFENLSVTQRLIPNMRSRLRPSAGRRQSSVQHLLEILDTAVMILELDTDDSFLSTRSSFDAESADAEEEERPLHPEEKD